MASISGVSGSNSIYGNRNVISGLASGMDTEAMIENSVAGYKAKITALSQKQTILQWKQESYRSIISKMVGLTEKYTSYLSDTNLFSPGFFDRAVTVTPQGANAGAVSATGKSNSNISIDRIKQLATTASYRVSGLGGGSSVPTISAGTGINLSDSVDVSTISGTMTFAYGNETVSINLGKNDVFASTADLAKAIEEKLADQRVTTSSGSKPASDVIKVNLSSDGKTISFTDAAGAGNSVYIKGASTAMKDVLGITPGDRATSFTVNDVATLKKPVYKGESLSEQTMDFTLDGVKKTITLPKYEPGVTTAEDFRLGIEKELNKAFGSGKVKVENTDTSGSLQLKFTTKEGSTMSINSSVGKTLGFDGNTSTSYLNTGKTLGDLGVLNGMTPVDKDKDGNDLYALTINGTEVGRFTKDTSLDSVLLSINNSDAGVSVSYSKITNEFQFKAKDSGAMGQIDFGDDPSSLANKLFGDRDGDGAADGTLSSGKDAIFTATINDNEVEMTRSSNVVNIEGLNVTLNKTFGYDASGAEIADTEAVDFSSKSDADTIVKAIKSFVDDYNKMVTEIRGAFRTMPAQRSNGTKYAPLTDEDMADMSESAIKAYEEKAKQGILFADNDLASLYSKLTSAITPSGNDGGAMRAIGISTSYSEGLTTIKLDEKRLRSALEANPDSVKQVFTKTKENGAPTDGLMQSLKTTLDTYASTSIATPGVLVRKSGTPLSSISMKDNAWQKQLNDLDDQVDRWSTKMSDRIDYYTRQFTQLEQMMSQMNSQSSSLMSMMGGGQ